MDTTNEKIEAVLDYMFDHFKHFQCLPIDIEIDDKLYDLTPMVEYLHNLEEL